MVEGPRGFLAGWTLAGAMLVASLVSGTANLYADDSARRVNSPGHRTSPYLVIVSIDGFRWDYPERFNTPVIDRIAARGLKAEFLQPVFPTLTFPNHFSLATGLLPDHHGLVANEFPDGDKGNWYHYKDRSTVQDGSWYLADPIWVTAEKQGMLSAAYYFVGTEANISGIWPTHWHDFNPDISGETRVQKVLEWLSLPEQSRPHLITLYFEDVDDDTHSHGVTSARGIAAIERVDGYLGQLLDGIEQLPFGENIYLVLVSDHGMAAYDSSKPTLVLDELVDLGGIRAVEGGPYVFLYLEQGPDASRAQLIRDTINENWDCGTARLRDEAPAAWQIGESQRWPDLFVLADNGCAVISTESRRHKITAGDHGWSPDSADMRGIFYALGPRIPPATRVGAVLATDIYPMMMDIMGLTPPHKIDGDPDRLPSLLLPKAAVR